MVSFRNAGGEAGGVRGAAEDTASRPGAVHQEGCLSGQGSRSLLNVSECLV